MFAVESESLNNPWSVATYEEGWTYGINKQVLITLHVTYF
jgi:hypothetical protein